ncbi:uncharacterized protein LOC130795127 [Actinidia eriantha]|uniref:uncharacterized protein LOC130795127 n=1 Tax=Actinidia eriantha TaxID=165200 RepID=UPI00258FAA8E|nr:uncharacterized protein LOC130795127 [Actinidia eriantha]
MHIDEPCTSISDNLLRWEESKRLHNSPGIGSRLGIAADRFGILCMQASKSVGVPEYWWYLTGSRGLFSGETQVAFDAANGPYISLEASVWILSFLLTITEESVSVSLRLFTKFTENFRVILSIASDMLPELSR